jgi:alginate O-acetyltransferase complex protein AlgI
MTHATSAAEIPAEVPFTLVLGAVISLLPATAFYPALVRAYETRASLRTLTVAALLVIYVLAVARAVSAPFQPFIYFRF